MNVAIPIAKDMTGQGWSFTLSQNTLVPLSFVVILLLAGVYNETRMVAMQGKLDTAIGKNLSLEADLKEIRATYVSQKEFNLTLQRLYDKLDAIQAALNAKTGRQ